MSAVIVVTRFVWGGTEPSPVLQRLMKMAESHRAVLIEIEASDSKTLYLATEFLEVNGERYEGIVQGGLFLDHTMDYAKESDADTSLVILNKRISEQSTLTDRFTDLFSSYDLSGKRVRVLEYIEGVDYGDLPKLLKGRISHPISYDREQFSCDVVVDKSFYVNAPPKIIYKDAFPDAPDLSLRKRIPYVFGYMENQAYPAQPKIGVPAWPIDAPRGWLALCSHTPKQFTSGDDIYEVRNGFLCKVTTDFGGGIIRSVDGGVYYAALETNERELLVNPRGHENESGTITNPERLYDQDLNTACTIYKNAEVDLRLTEMGPLGDQYKSSPLQWPRICFKIDAITGGGDLRIRHVNKDGNVTSITTEASTGTFTVYLDKNSIDDWQWGDDKIRLDYISAAADVDYVQISQVWVVVKFSSDIWFGQPRGLWGSVADIRHLAGGEFQLDVGMKAGWYPFSNLVQPADIEWPSFLIECRGYQEAGVIKDNVVDVINAIHTEMLDTDKFEIDSTSFSTAKTDAAAYYGAGYPAISMPVANTINSEELVYQLCRHYGFQKFTLPTGSATWKPKISLIYHKLDAAAATYGTPLTLDIVKNLKIGKTDVAKIRNEVFVRYNYNWGTGKYEDEVYIKRDPDSGVWSADPTDAARVAAAENSYDDYGYWSEGFAIELQYNIFKEASPGLSDTQAQNVLQRTFDFFYKPRNNLKFEVFLSDLEIGHIIEFNSSMDTNWGKLFGETWASKYFRVLGLGFSSEGVHWRKVYAEQIPITVT